MAYVLRGSSHRDLPNSNFPIMASSVIQARNSALFYFFDLIHPTLRDITLFHETLNKDRQPFRVTVGEPISAASIPRNSEEGIAMLRKATLALGGKDAPTVNLISTSGSLARLLAPE